MCMLGSPHIWWEEIDVTLILSSKAEENVVMAVCFLTLIEAFLF